MPSQVPAISCVILEKKMMRVIHNLTVLYQQEFDKNYFQSLINAMTSWNSKHGNNDSLLVMVLLMVQYKYSVMGNRLLRFVLEVLLRYSAFFSISRKGRRNTFSILTYSFVSFTRKLQTTPFAGQTYNGMCSKQFCVIQFYFSVPLLTYFPSSFLLSNTLAHSLPWSIDHLK